MNRVKNRVCEILGVRYPIILGAMRGITLAEMAAAVSESGGFGQIAASSLFGEPLRRELQKARALTDRPIGVNIPVYRPHAADALEIAIEMGVKAITTSAGDPRKLIDRIKAAGLRVLHKVSTLEMGLKAQAAGVDGVIATGFEAGGHLGREDVTTFCLIPQLADALEIPVVAAGGIGDARGVVAAFALGAEAVEIGTRFLATRECPVPGFWKDSILEAKCDSTTVVGDGRMPLRVLKTHPPSAGADHDAGHEKQAIVMCGQVAGIIREIVGAGDVIPKIVGAIRGFDRGLGVFLEEVGP